MLTRQNAHALRPIEVPQQSAIASDRGDNAADELTYSVLSYALEEHQRWKQYSPQNNTTSLGTLFQNDLLVK